VFLVAIRIQEFLKEIWQIVLLSQVLFASWQQWSAEVCAISALLVFNTLQCSGNY